MGDSTSTTPTPGVPAATPAPAAEPIWAKPSIGVYSLTLFALCLGISWWLKNDTAFNLMIGAVIANANTVMQFYFGSSSGSQKKDETIAAQSASRTTGAVAP